MSLVQQVIYVNLISNRLPKLTKRGDYTWNFRCPFCGDSQKKTYKKRGYLYKKGDGLVYHCHNCGASHSFEGFLKRIDRGLYDDYLLTTLQRRETAEESFAKVHDDKQKEKFEELHKRVKIELPSVESLDNDHIAKKYCIERRIPEKHFGSLFYTDDFEEFINRIKPDNEHELRQSEKRLVIPYWDEENNLLGMQGRAFSSSAIKYITIKLDEDNVKVFGLERLDKNKVVYVTEGPIDSLFLDNAIASMDARLYHVVDILGKLDFVFIFDNEPRNKFTVKHMEKAVELGYKVFVWPIEFENYKDINDLAMAGYSTDMIERHIRKRTFTDLRAILEISQWKKT